MSRKTTQAIVHHAEELSQAREYTAKEAQGLVMAAIYCGAWGALAVVMLAVGYRLYERAGLTTALGIIVLAAGAGLAVGGAVLFRGVGQQIDGLRSWREATTYAPPQPEAKQAPSPWRPPIPAHHQGGTTYLDMNERPALPSPQEARQITPDVVTEILRASIEEYGGEWSRRKLMALRIQGQKVSRGMYEELTGALHQAGILHQTRQGGFVLPEDVQDFDDLRNYFPNLPGGTGGQTGRAGNGGGFEDTQPDGRGMNTGELLRRKFIELECNTAAFLEWRRNHGENS